MIVDEYLPEFAEGPNGTRSDIVLVPKSSDAGPPNIIEFQRTVDKTFMKRAIGYCLQATKRFECDPILLIVCVETLWKSIFQIMEKCDNLPIWSPSRDEQGNHLQLKFIRLLRKQIPNTKRHLQRGWL